VKGIGRPKRSHDLAYASSILNINIQNRTGKDLDRSSGPPLALRQDPSDFLELNCPCQMHAQLVPKKPPGTEVPFSLALFTLTNTLLLQFTCYSQRMWIRDYYLIFSSFYVAEGCYHIFLQSYP